MTRPSAHPDPLVGTTINGRFKIAELIARGGMGKVYRAEQAPLGRVCAVKVLSPRGDGSQADFEQRFFFEASVCSRLTHPNTVTIFDYGRTDDGVYFMAMEYLEGRTLKRALHDDGPFAGDRARHVARQICRSLREAHALGVIHRDLKPANVFLLEHGDETDVVKVLDFGLVKNVVSDGEDLTQVGQFMGSPRYMAPEQIRGEHVDARTDIYAIGVMLHEMLIGKPPFERANSLDVLIAHVNEPPPRLRELDPSIDPALEAIVLRCLEKNPSLRFADMGELLASLRDRDSAMTASGSQELGRTSMLNVHVSATDPPASASVTPPLSTTATPKKAVWIAGAMVAAAAIVASVSFGMRRHSSPSSDDKTNVTAVSATTTSGATASVKPSTSAPSTTTKVAEVSSDAVTIESEPLGARVEDSQHVILCDRTPCKLRLDAPTMVVTLVLDGYGSERVKVATGDPTRHIVLEKRAAFVSPHTTTNATATAPPPSHSGYLPGPY